MLANETTIELSRDHGRPTQVHGGQGPLHGSLQVHSAKRISTLGQEHDSARQTSQLHNC